jgi:hypothetical protein
MEKNAKKMTIYRGINLSEERKVAEAFRGNTLRRSTFNG